MDDVLSLANIRDSLIRQEDTIIFSLIERSQFAVNSAVYSKGGVLEYYLKETEQLHGKIRRFTSPDEHPFFPENVPELVLRPITYASVLAPFNKEINVNARVMQLYVDHLLPGIAAAGDDNNYGSSAMYDGLALQALSKRVHYGKFVAEAKFLDHREEYSELIRRQDSDAIMDLLTNKAVEKQVIARVRRKTAMFAQDYTGDGPVEGEGRIYKVQPDRVAELFRDWVMPLTKDVEVMYLLRRLEWDR